MSELCSALYPLKINNTTFTTNGYNNQNLAQPLILLVKIGFDYLQYLIG